MRRLSRRARAVVASAVVAVVSLVPALSVMPSAVADTDGQAWSVSPVPPKGKTAAPRNYFIFEGEPGAVIKDQLLVQNFTPHPITFDIFGADGLNTDGRGSFALRRKSDKQVDVGAWIDPAVPRVTIYGGKAAKIPVKFRIPKNATPGDHAGGVVALNTRVEAQSQGSTSIGIQRAIAARAYIRVSGSTSPGFEISDVQVTHDRGPWPWSGDGTGTLTYTVENTGNLRLALTGNVLVKGWGKDDVLGLAELPDLLPGSKVTLTRELTGIPAAGRVEVEVAMNGGEDLDEAVTVTFTLVPWALLVALLIVAAAVLAMVLRRRGAVRRRLEAAGEAPKISVTAGA